MLDLPKRLYNTLKTMFILRRHTAGRRVRIRGGLHLLGKGTLQLGDYVNFHEGALNTEIDISEGARVVIGSNSFVNTGCILNATKLIQIGDRCRLGYRVVILDNAFHGIAVGERHICPPAKPVIIEDDVWIATGAQIHPGVTIGRGSIVAAGAQVTKDVPPMSKVAGVPAVVIGKVTEESERPTVVAVRPFHA